MIHVIVPITFVNHKKTVRKKKDSERRRNESKYQRDFGKLHLRKQKEKSETANERKTNKSVKGE